MEIFIRIDGSPVPKGRPRFSRRETPQGKPYSKAHTPARSRSYEQQVSWQARAAMGAREPLEGALVVKIDAVLRIPASWPKWKQEAAETHGLAPAVTPDLDNLVKAALDGCNKIVWLDDAQIVELHARKTYGREPSLLIRAAPL